MSKSPELMRGILPLYKRLSNYPMGKFIFTQLFCFKAPYFGSINPQVVDLKQGDRSDRLIHTPDILVDDKV
jgi:hypothetical protein